MKNPDAFADSVVLAIKSAIGPIVERLAAVEARLALLGDLRDRVVAVEAKAAVQTPDPQLTSLEHRFSALETKAVQPLRDDDLIQRLAAAEARIAMLPAAEKAMTDLRDRVVTVETKAAVPQQDAAVGDLREKISAISEWRSVVTQMPAQVSALSETVTKELADVRARLGVVETKEDPAPVVDLGPMGERVAAAEARLSTLGDLRDRVVAVETKSSAPTAVEVVPDLAPVLERVASAEARLSVLGDLRDRVVAIETKSAVPLPPDAAVGDIRDRLLAIETKSSAPTAVEYAVVDIKSRLTVLESRDVVAPVVVGEDLRDRVVTLETRAAGPSVTDMAVVDLRERLGALERRVSDDKVTPEIAAIRERLAVAEVKAPVPGPAGTDGANGKDGTDGMGWDDLSVAHDGERSFTIKMMRGERVKDVGAFTLPVQIYRGVYTEGRTYEPGDTVTYARSLWHCQKTTVLKPDGVTRDPVTGESKGAQGKDFWKLAVKGGQDGKDGRDGHDQRPVVSVGRPQ